MPIKEALAMARILAAEIRRSLVAARRSLVATRRPKATRRNLMATRRIPTPKRTRLAGRGKSPTKTKKMRRGKTRAASISSLAQTNKLSSTAETCWGAGATVETETTDLMDLRIATEETGEGTVLEGATTTTGPGRPATGNRQTATIGERKTTAKIPAASQVTKTPEAGAVSVAAAATMRNSRGGVWVWDETAAPALRSRG